MLELVNIRKVYPAGDSSVEALKGISLQFRKSEFVSILGPSGCGKTTMLNIIGGLDKYTEGDLIINGRSTKEYKDRDWDTYRNHSVGFVFQSYNLIPHQTVLQNVELALTLSGVSKKERRERAIQALKDVGLENQIKKRPGEMSGGQMQRVAIARALVNNPDIILADEPTGALDTETSVQVMEILKTVSKDRLVVMVTHNPDLANRYSTRIINMLDGIITGDSMPLTADEYDTEKTEAVKKAEEEKGKKKPSMSIFTSFGLSLKNLFTKKGRTILTSFAGSIGIIGIALIYAVSNGTTIFINQVQEDTLSSYPLTIEATHIDMSSLLESFIGSAESEKAHDKDAVYQKMALYKLTNSLNNMTVIENDLRSFKAFVDGQMKNDTTGLKDALTGIQYTYDTQLLVYTKDESGNIIKSDTEELIKEVMSQYMGMDVEAMSASSASTSGVMSLMSQSSGSNYVIWQELLAGKDGEPVNDILKEQYDCIYGSWPSAYNEIVLVVDENNEIADMTLYSLGLKTREEILEVVEAAIAGEQLDEESRSWSYQDICGKTFKIILNSDCYKFDESTGRYVDVRESEIGLAGLYNNAAVELKITGIIRPSEGAVATMLRGSIAYTSALTEYVINACGKTEAAQYQMDHPTIDVITGLPFRSTVTGLTTEEKAQKFKEYVAEMNVAEKAKTYISLMSVPKDEDIEQYVQMVVGSMSRAEMEAMMLQAAQAQGGYGGIDIEAYLSTMSDEEIAKLFSQAAAEQYKAEYAGKVQEEMGKMEIDQLAGLLDLAVGTATDEMLAEFYDNGTEFSLSTYEDNLIELGYVDLDNPSTVNLYPSSFKSKEKIQKIINNYNDSQDEYGKLVYTDMVGMLMSSVTTIIDAITYVLIAFVSISLIVSSIMIGVITLISVQERTKEIGILRAIGASKWDVSSMFNAETVIIGFAAGLLGILVTYLLCIPINLIIHSLTDLNNLSAQLPLSTAGILILISVLLTLIAGIIPSRSAAKKDPVVALRTE